MREFRLSTSMSLHLVYFAFALVSAMSFPLENLTQIDRPRPEARMGRRLRVRLGGSALDVGGAQPGHGAKGSQPGADGGEDHVDGIACVADDCKGGEQIPH